MTIRNMLKAHRESENEVMVPFTYLEFRRKMIPHYDTIKYTFLLHEHGVIKPKDFETSVIENIKKYVK